MGDGHPSLDVYSFPAQTMGPPPNFYQPPPHPLDSYPHVVQYDIQQCGFRGFCGVTSAFHLGAPPHLTFGIGGIAMGGPRSLGGGNAANGWVANALVRRGMVVPSNANTPDRVALASIQYGANPAHGFHHHQHQHRHQRPESGSTEDFRRLQNREHARRSRVRKKFMLESLQQQVRGLQDEHSTLRKLVQNVGVPLSPMVARSVLDNRSPDTPAVPALLVDTAALPEAVAMPTPDDIVMKPPLNEGTTDDRRSQNREHARRSRVRKKFMLESLQQQVRGLQDEHSTLRKLVQNVSVYYLPSENVRTMGAFHMFLE
ncbi:hypothetical protein ACHAW5_002134 [Stephanodiscus triporus]|uniref:BZIP domain-containing protein n=1 Tax=Stephanodiscus triporus TaxID=2934178 RepID=A0ABD3PZX2_9STRA